MSTCVEPFPLLTTLCVHPKSSILGFLRRGTYIGLQSAIRLFPLFHFLQGFRYPRNIYFEVTTAHIFTFVVTLHRLLYYSAFLIRFCKPLGVSDIHTI